MSTSNGTHVNNLNDPSDSPYSTIYTAF